MFLRLKTSSLYILHLIFLSVKIKHKLKKIMIFIRAYEIRQLFVFLSFFFNNLFQLNYGES